MYQTLKEETVPIQHEFSQKVKEEGSLPNYFYEASITGKPKSPSQNFTKVILQC